MEYHFKIHREKDGYWAECLELDGCFTQADSLKGLRESCEEALNLYLEEPGDSGIVFPLPGKRQVKKNVLKVPVSPELASAVLLKHCRSTAGLTQKQTANLLGMKNVYSYQRLEKKSNPTVSMLKKIISVFPEFKPELIFK
jgi:antitoxin HicB